MEAWRAQEAVLDGVEARPPGHASDGGAGGRRRGGGPRRAVLGGVHRGALWGGEGAASGGGVRGDLYEGDRFGRVVSVRRRHRRHRVEVVQPDGREGHHGAEGHRELGAGGHVGAPHLRAVHGGAGAGGRGEGGGRGARGGGGGRHRGGGRRELTGDGRLGFGCRRRVRRGFGERVGPRGLKRLGNNSGLGGQCLGLVERPRQGLVVGSQRVGGGDTRACAAGRDGLGGRAGARVW